MAEVLIKQWMTLDTTFKLFTKPTISTPTRISSILDRIWMLLGTMNFPSILRGYTIASQSIFSGSNYFKMFQIYTIANTTKVIKLPFSGNRFNHVFIKPTMSHYIFPTIISTATNGKLPITSRKFTLPNPATIRDFFNKSIKTIQNVEISFRVSVKRIYQLLHTAIISYTDEGRVVQLQK